MSSSAKKFAPFSTKTNNSLSKDITVFVGLIVDQVLDIEILHHAAKALVTQWPILGGELITSTNPYSFRAGTKADFQSRTWAQTSLKEILPFDFHPNETSSTTNEPTFHEQPNGRATDKLFHFNSTAILDMLPKTLLAIRATILKDASLLGFRIPHILADAESVHRILEAYASLISKPTSKISKLVDPPDVIRPLSELVKADTGVKMPKGMGVEGIPNLFIGESFAIGLVAWCWFFFCFALKTFKLNFFKLTRSQERFIYLPRTLVEKWKREGQKELDQQGGKREIGVVKLSNLDMITAWILKKCAANSTQKNQVLNLMYLMSYRFALPPPQPGTEYLKSSQYELRVPFPTLDLPSQATVASNIRTTILRSKQSSIVKRNLEYHEKTTTELIAPQTLDPYVISSWCSSRFDLLDFSGAVIEGRNEEGKKAKVLLTLPRITLPLGIVLEPYVIILRDGEDGYWVRANLSNERWSGFGV